MREPPQRRGRTWHVPGSTLCRHSDNGALRRRHLPAPSWGASRRRQNLRKVPRRQPHQRRRRRRPTRAPRRRHHRSRGRPLRSIRHPRARTPRRLLRPRRHRPRLPHPRHLRRTLPARFLPSLLLPRTQRTRPRAARQPGRLGRRREGRNLLVHGHWPLMRFILRPAPARPRPPGPRLRVPPSSSTVAATAPRAKNTRTASGWPPRSSMAWTAA